MLTSGRTESVHDAPTTHDHKCRDAEPTKHTQTFTEGKGSGDGDIGLSLSPTFYADEIK